MIQDLLECSVTGPQDRESKCHNPFCHLYQKSLSISVSDTSFFPSELTWEIILTTESLYNHANLREICPFMKGSRPARLSQTSPSGTPAVWLGSRLGLGTGLQLSVATGCRAAGISWLNFSVILFAVIFEGRQGNFREGTWIKSHYMAVWEDTNTTTNVVTMYFFFLFQIMGFSKSWEEIKNSKASFPLIQLPCLIFLQLSKHHIFCIGRDFIWMHFSQESNLFWISSAFFYNGARCCSPMFRFE